MSNCLIERLNGVADNNNLPTFDKYAGVITSYIIDQRYASENPVVYKEPSEIIVKDVPSKDATETVKIEEEVVKKDIIARIRDLSDFYIGSVVPGSTKLWVTKLSKENKGTLFNGKPVENYLNWGDIYMKLPRFWWRVVTLETDLFRIEFTMDETVAEEDDTWQEWDGNTFIGVYLASIGPYGYGEDYNWLRSVPNGYITPSNTFSEYKVLSRSKSTTADAENLSGFSLITYETKKMLALLAWGWLGHVSLHSIDTEFNFEETEPDTSSSGYADAEGFNDKLSTISSSNNTVKYSNFWGIEDFGKEIWIDNLTIKGGGEPGYFISDYEGNSRSIYGYEVASKNSASILKVRLEAGEVLPKEAAGNMVADKAFYSNTYSRNGLLSTVSTLKFICSIYNGYSSTKNTVNARLQYHGEWEESDEPYFTSAPIPLIIDLED